MKLVKADMPDGSGFHISGQVFKRVGSRPYVNKAGTTIELGVWATACATCGMPCEIVMTEKTKWPSRRCDRCVTRRVPKDADDWSDGI